MLLALELIGIAVVYQFGADFECGTTDAEGTCRFLRSLVTRAISIFAGALLYVWARPRTLGGLERAASGSWLAAALHFGGVGLILLPLIVFGGGNLSASFAPASGLWLAGAVTASVGALLWLAAPRSWWAWLRRERFVPLVVLAIAALLSDLANASLPLWNWGALTWATFEAVRLLLEAIGTAVYADPAGYLIGMDSFLVSIAPQCSGVEGFALVTGFLALYAVLFRHEIRQGRLWFVVLPLSLALSWGFNVLRIAALVAIGAYVSPDLAVNGFHSHAGWMFFTLLALGLLYAVQATPWLHGSGGAGRVAAASPLRKDLNAALIVPFIAFMLATVAVSALAPNPDLAYPVKALAMAAALAAFHPIYRRLRWSFDTVAVAAGALVGIGWILLRPPPGAEVAAFATLMSGLGGAALAAWVVARLVGAVLLVPVVEELFFRGYVLRRMDWGGLVARVAAITVSSGLFALLHGRWLEAFCAGVLFAVVALRRGRVTDAIMAHVVANLIVAGWAAGHNDWSAL